VLGGIGDDTITTGDGRDWIRGEEGDDTISAGGGNDRIIGGLGDDTIHGGAGSDIVWGDGEVFAPGNFDLANPDNFDLPDGFALNEARYPTGFQAPRINAKVLLGQSIGETLFGVDGNAAPGSAPTSDGRDTIFGDAGIDFIFAGSNPNTSGNEVIDGGADADYIDGGGGEDTVLGGAGDDVIRGGAGDDSVSGNDGIDQVYGDDGDDVLYGDAGRKGDAGEGGDASVAEGSQAGQRMYGGGGSDRMYAYADITGVDSPNYATEIVKIGDEMHGGAGNDYLFGNLRRDVLLGDSGNDYLHGEAVAGNSYATNFLADVTGGSAFDAGLGYSVGDRLFGGSGQDDVYGGGGDDELWGGADGDRLEGQQGNDRLYGGGWIDFLILDVAEIYFGPGESPVDIIDGHFGDASFDDVADDNATDILLVKGIDLHDDTIVIGEVQPATGPRQLHFDYNGREILAPWRNATGIPLVEQIRVTGLGGDDHIEFLREDDTVRGIFAVDTSYLTTRGNDFVGHFEGGAGNDTLIGGNARDRIDGGRGSDTIFGYGGNDRLWGEKPTDIPGPVDTTTVDTIFGGQGNDDLVGGPGRNFLYAWSQQPKVSATDQFGVFVDAAGNLYDTDGSADGVSPPRALEDTGIDRMLGSSKDDELYGGTGPGFLFGNGGNDKLFRADGSLFESLDGGLGGDDWKNYAKEYSSVWYVAGSGADDRITVDYVTEPGLLRDYHLVTRLTRNGDVYSFAAQVRLDPTGLAAGGAFDATDSTIETDAVEGRSGGLDPNAALPTLADVNVRNLAIAEGVLPGEGAYDVILIDALGGNDTIEVGPTVQKTVWIDAGEGDDRITVTSGNAILVDNAEEGSRNDTVTLAKRLATPGGETIDGSTTFEKFTIDNPDDVDWFTFKLSAASPTGVLRLTGATELDALGLAIFADPAGAALATGPVVFAADEGEGAGRNDTAATAHALPDPTSFARIRGLTTDTATDFDFYRIDLAAAGVDGDWFGLIKELAAANVGLALVRTTGEVVRTAQSNSVLGLKLDLAGIVAGEYLLRVSSDVAARYDLVAHVGVPNLATTDDDRNYIGNTVLDRGGPRATGISLAGLAADTVYHVRVDSTNRIPTVYDLAFDLGGTPQVVTMTPQTKLERQDVLKGGSGNDVLQGGMGEDWIFGDDGNDVLSGGYDRSAEDLLFGGAGDDTFQILPDRLPSFAGTDATIVPELTDEMFGGEGDDRVLFLGGDLDDLSRPVNDDVSIRWDRNLQRYEFTALGWDTANQDFIVADSVVASTLVLPTSVDTAWSAIDFQLRVPGGEAFESIHVDAFFGKMPAWRALIQTALDARFGAGIVEVEDIEGVLRLRAHGDGLELRAAATNPVVTQLGFTPLTAAAPIYRQNYAFYRTQSVEHTVLDLRAGDDVVHANPEYKFPNTNSEWGIKRGNLEEGARLGGLTILGGAGADRLFGGEQDDTIDGGEGDDIVMGFGGSDRLTGGSGNDLISGSALLEPDRHEFGTSQGVRGRNDVSTYAAQLPAVRAGSIIDGLNFHLGDVGDWYAIEAPESLRAFGDRAASLLTSDMIEVVKTHLDVNGVWQEEPVKAQFFLFAAENTGTAESPRLQPRGSFSGVPEHYLLHVVNSFTPALPADTEASYRIRFKAPLGTSTAVDATDAERVLSSTTLGGQPVYVPLGDINGDRFEDAVVAVLDNVFDAQTGLTRSFAKIALGRAGGIDATSPIITVASPTQFLSNISTNRTLVQNVGDLDGDGLSDIVFAVSAIGANAGLQGAYLLFGRTVWEPSIDLASATFADAQNVFIRVSSGPVTATGVGNMADFYGLGMRAEYFDLSDGVTLGAIPDVADGKFLRNTSDGGHTVLTLTGLPAHDVLDLEFLLAAIGAWGANGPDRFNVLVDGVSVFSHRLNNSAVADPLAYVAPAGGRLVDREDRGFGLAVDSLYDFGVEPSLRGIAHTASSVTIEFFADGDGWTGGATESFALDHVRVATGTTGSDARTIVFAGDMDGGRPAQFTGEGVVEDVGAFGPVAIRTEADAVAIGGTTGINGVTGLGSQYLLRWSGQILSVGTTADFYIGGDERVQFVLNGQVIVADTADRGSVLVDGLGAFTPVTVSLNAGFNDFEFRMLNRTGDSAAVLAFDADPGPTLALRLLSDTNGDGNATTGDTSLWRASSGLGDLVLGTGEKLRVWGGRDRAEWIADAATNNTGGADDPDLVPFARLPYFALDGTAPVGVGDVTGDTRPDVAALVDTDANTIPDKLRILQGGTLVFGNNIDIGLAGITMSTQTQLRSAGDVDGDGATDLLLTSPSGGTTQNYLIYGGNFVHGTTLSSMVASGAALRLPRLDFIGVGDLDGDGRGDLAAAAKRATQSLDESSATPQQHEVTMLWFGATRPELVAKLQSDTSSGVVVPLPPADVVLEPQRATYTTSTALPRSTLFGTAQVRAADDTVSTQFAVSAPAGDALRFYDMTQFGAAPATGTTLPAVQAPSREFRFEMATPVAPGFGAQPVTGIDISEDVNPSLDNAFAITGVSANERLSRTVALADFNGDRRGDVLLAGATGGYVLLGPVNLDTVADVRDEASIIVSGDLGTAAERMGDVSGDGLSDLVFVKRISAANTQITVISGNVLGEELPRVIDDAWVTAKLGQAGQNLVRRIGTRSGFGATVSVLNWNDDGRADIVLSSPGVFDFSVPGDFDTAAVVFSGNSLWASSVPDALSIITTDETSVDALLGTVFPGATWLSSASRFRNSSFTVTVAGDVDGDGRDDLVVADRGAATVTVPNGQQVSVGRAYVLTSRSSQHLNDAETIIQDLSFGASVSALGDLNRDGYDDFAIGRTVETRVPDTGAGTGPGALAREGGLFVYFGGTRFAASTQLRLQPADADIIVSRQSHDEAAEGFSQTGTLRATAGDFDGDGRQDLVVGETASSLRAAGGTTTLDQSSRGAVWMFFDVARRGRALSLESANPGSDANDADVRIAGQFELDQFGTLSASPRVDLNDDGIDDLVIGAAAADLVGARPIVGAGRVFVAYGAGRPPELPAASGIVDLANSDTGSFVVRDGSNRPLEYVQSLSGGTDAEIERWYRFTTLGDGDAESYVRVNPGQTDGFIEAVKQPGDTVTAPLPVTVGAQSRARSTVDGAVGSLFAGYRFDDTGRVAQWSIFTGDFAGQRSVTPVLMKLRSDGTYEITGIGATRTVSGNQPFEFDFGTVSGSDAVGAGYYLGWKDGGLASDNAGVIAYDPFYSADGGSQPIAWFGAGQGVESQVHASATFRPGATFARTYAVNATVTRGAVLEFDLGQLLGLVGDTQALAVAKLHLDAPAADEPIAAPTGVSGLTASGGRIYFTGSTPTRGQELWVTDGTEAGTRLVKDANPGATSSSPRNLTDVAGTLYFTANASFSGVELWKTDGTTAGTAKVTDVVGSAFDFRAVTGSAVLTADGTLPSDGQPVADFRFALELVTLDGALTTLSIEVPFSETRVDTSRADLRAQIATELEGALAGAGFDTTDVTVALDGTTGRLSFAAADDAIVRMRVVGANPVGFGASVPSAHDVAIDAAVAGPASGQTADLAFGIALTRLGGTTTDLSVTVAASATTGNTNLTGLAADLNQALDTRLSAAGFQTGAVSFVVRGDRLALVAANTSAGLDIVRLRITGATAIGFGADVTSTNRTSVLAAQAAPTDGRPDIPLTFTLRVTRADGSLVAVPVTVGFRSASDPQTVDNTTVANLVADIATRLQDALTAAGLPAQSITVADVGDHLVFTAASDDLLAFTIDGGASLGFTATTASVRQGDLVYFTAYDDVAGSLWVTDGTAGGTHVVDGGAATNPGQLTVVGDALYFTATDGVTFATTLKRVGAGGAVVAIALPAGATTPSNLADIGGVLVFSADVGGSDREVFRVVDGAGAATAFTTVPGTSSSPSGFTSVGTRFVFAARDFADGAYTSGSGTGRELWIGDTATGNVSLLKNIAPDTRPTSGFFDTIFQIPNAPAAPFDSLADFDFIFLPTVPGQMNSSNPGRFTQAGAFTYFTATDGTTGFELYRTDGTTGGTVRIADLTPGSASSSIGDMVGVDTAAGDRLFFSQGGQLRMTSGGIGDVQTVAPGATSPFELMAVDGRLFFVAGDKLWTTDGTTAGTRRIDRISPPPIDLRVSVLSAEGDDRVTAADTTGAAASTTTHAMVAGSADIDLTAAINAALARGDSRVTIRIDALDAETALAFSLAGGFSVGKTGLEVQTAKPAMLVDLYTADGQLVDKGRSIVDLRNTESGTFFARVYRADAASTAPADYTLTLSAPIRGWSHEYDDRDTIHGGDGDDLIVGGKGLDRIYGDSGRDAMKAEQIEVRDRQTEDSLTPVVTNEELSNKPLAATDALVTIADQGLQLALAEALGLPITRAWNGTSLIHPDGGSSNTSIAVSNAANFRERLWASDLAEIAVLDASARGVASLRGLEFAVNLESLNLSFNSLDATDLQSLIPGQFGKRKAGPEATPIEFDREGAGPNPTYVVDVAADGRDTQVGLKSLRNLALDFNANLADLQDLARLRELSRLSFDGAMPSTDTARAGLIEDIANLHFLQPDGSQRSLELLSLDNVNRAWSHVGSTFACRSILGGTACSSTGSTRA
jgi:ELWxxDGT repeat protein